MRRELGFRFFMCTALLTALSATCAEAVARGVVQISRSEIFVENSRYVMMARRPRVGDGLCIKGSPRPRAARIILVDRRKIQAKLLSQLMREAKNYPSALRALKQSQAHILSRCSAAESPTAIPTTTPISTQTAVPTASPGYTASPTATATSVPTGSSMQSSVTKDSVTWYFDRAYPVGQFANGDYWVQGPVTIVNSSPSWDGIRNGSMLDPQPGANSQGYDRMNTWLPYQESVRLSLPATINPVSGPRSLVSVKSLPACVSGGAYECIDIAAVLTIVSQVPAAGSFRPAYVAGTKTIFTVSQLNTGILPLLAYPTDDNAQAQIQGLLTDEKLASRLWLDHGPPGQAGATIHPSGSMISYPAYNTRTYLVPLALMVMIDIPQRHELTVRLVQLGIDLYPISLAPGFAWRPYGGFGPGRLWPILFAGMLLNDSAMQHPPYKLDSNTWKFGENGSTYLGAVTSEYPQGKPLYGAPCTNDAFYEWNRCYILCIEAAGNSTTCTTQCGSEPSGDKDCRYHPNVVDIEDRFVGYIEINAPAWIGQALAAKLMNAESLWGHPAFFGMAERWVTHQYLWPSWGNPTVWGRGGYLVEALWDSYYHCTNGIQDQGESAIDIGGNCP